MSVGISYFSCLPHVVLQVLPAHSAGKIFHDNSVVGTSWRTIFIKPDGSVTAIASASTTSIITTITATAATPLFTISTVRCSTGNFNRNSFTQQVSAIHFVASIIGIPVIVEFHETKSILHGYFTNPSKFAEKAFNIFFPRSVRQSSDINASRHLGHLR